MNSAPSATFGLTASKASPALSFKYSAPSTALSLINSAPSATFGAAALAASYAALAASFT
jgi:hypothetical protein